MENKARTGSEKMRPPPLSAKEYISVRQALVSLIVLEY